MFREYHRWFSTNLQRHMELLVFGHSGPRVIVFPTREGRFYDYENFGLVGSLADHLSSGKLQLFCVDSADSEALYARNSPPWDRIARHNLFEMYILEEVLPFSFEMNPNFHVIAHGCSFGAYHSVNIAFRHPVVFREVVALSGRYDLTKSVGSFVDLLDGHYTEDVYYHMPNHFLPNLSDEALLGYLRNMRIVLAVGKEDAFLDSNFALSKTLNEKGVPHELHIWEGEAHRSRDWRKMVRIYLAR